MLADDLRDDLDSGAGSQQLRAFHPASIRTNLRSPQWHYLEEQRGVIARNHYAKLDGKLREKSKV